MIALSLVSLNIKIVQTKYWIFPYLRRGWGGLNLDTTIPTFFFPITGGGGWVKRGRTKFTISVVCFFWGLPLPLWMWSLQIWSDIVTSVAGVLLIEASLLEMTPAQAVKLRVTPLLSASCLNESSMGGTSLRLPTSHGCCWLWFAMLWYFLLTDCKWVNTPWCYITVLQTLHITLITITHHEVWVFLLIYDLALVYESWQGLSIQIKDSGNNNGL